MYQLQLLDCSYCRQLEKHLLQSYHCSVLFSSLYKGVVWAIYDFYDEINMKTFLYYMITFHICGFSIEGLIHLF